MAHEYVLVDIREMKSPLNGGTFYRITWVCLDDMTRWETDCQDNYRNWSKNGWQDIIMNKRYGVYTNLTRTTRQNNRKVAIITADSYPKLDIAIDTQSIAVDVVIAEQERLARQHQTSMFDSVFIVEDRK
jgi:hypothetical protein